MLITVYNVSRLHRIFKAIIKVRFYNKKSEVKLVTGFSFKKKTKSDFFFRFSPSPIRYLLKKDIANDYSIAKLIIR